jgi:O-antigen/teichoic acid export membrane protein
MSLIYAAGFTVGLFVVITLSPWLAAHWLNRQSIPVNVAGALLRVFALGAVTAVLRNYLSSLLRGLQRMEFSNGIDFLMTALQQLGGVVIVTRGGDAFAVAYWFTTCFVIATLAYFGVCARLLGWKSLVPWWHREIGTEHAWYAGNSVLLSVARTAYLQADKFVVSRLLPLIVFGYYAFAATLAFRGLFVAVAISMAALPSLVELSHRNAHGAFATLQADLEELQCFAAIPVFAAVAFAAHPLFSYLFTPSAANALVAPVALLCLGFFFNVATIIPSTAAMAANRPDLPMRASLITLAVALPLEVVLVRSFGLTGAGLGWAAGNAVLAASMVPTVYRAILDSTARSWVIRVAIALGLAAVSYGPGAVAAWRLGGRPWVVGACYLGASLAYAILVYKVATPSLRSFVKRRSFSVRDTSAEGA